MITEPGTHQPLVKKGIPFFYMLNFMEHTITTTFQVIASLQLANNSYANIRILLLTKNIQFDNFCKRSQVFETAIFMQDRTVVNGAVRIAFIR